MDGGVIGITLGVIAAIVCVPCISYCILKFLERPGGMLDGNQ